MSVSHPRILMQTELGDILLELYLQQAPITTNNFLRYIAKNRYMNSSFYRVVRADNQPRDRIKIAVIQGGLRTDNHPQSLPLIPHESTQQTGLRHEDGTISMARNQPGSASSEFFICVGDQPKLDFGGRRNPDGAGFAAFGKVFKGLDVVQKIHQSPAKEQTLTPTIRIIRISEI